LIGAGPVDQPLAGPPAASPPSSPVSAPGAVRVLVPEPTEHALQFHQSGIALWLIGTVWGILLPALFLFTGISTRMRNVARRVGKKWFFTVELYFVLFMVLYAVCDFPFNFLAGYIRGHAYGLSNQTLGKWLQDRVLSFAVVVAVGMLVVWIPYLLMKKSPRRWWLYTAFMALPLLFAGMMVYPIWIAPLFNHFGEMKNKPLEAKILALADRAGIEGARIYEVNKSVDTKAVNAYVAGFLGTKRIVLWDTLVEKLPEKQVLFILGHEMGHYVLGHVVQGLLVSSLIILVTLFLVHYAALAALRRFGTRLGIDHLHDVAAFPLLLLLVDLFSLFTIPAGLAFSRNIEHEADRFGLEITQDNQAAALSFVALEKENLGVPRPNWLIHIMRGSHPTGGERIDFCNEYRPWESGEELKYGRLFRGK
jgi:Zn-dependent protease with chaperone function